MNRFFSSKRLFVFIILGLLISFSIIFTKTTFASNKPDINCSNRYVTLVNPVRGRNLWSDRTLSPLISQYQAVKKYDFPVTWLLQYDTFSDNDLVNEIKKFDSSQETGLFLEVSKKLAGDSGVAFPIYLRWSDPGAVFLSAYAPSERKRLIDTSFKNYKDIFGRYPSSVGAWWIDSYSLDYMVKKYGVKISLIVADQKVTDSYGIWGQWWGFPYRPSKTNILVPASNNKNAQRDVVIQWAQRDPVSAYGGIGKYSLYSLQANDYLRVNENTEYFKKLTSQYLDCKNDIGQITVGLETGMESLIQPEEYLRQLEYLSSIDNLNAVTMSDFADKYFGVYGVNPEKVLFGEDGKNWEMTTSYRKNEYLGEQITYNQGVAFGDYFLKDSSSFLSRLLPINNNDEGYFPWFLLVGLLFMVIAIRFKAIKLVTVAFIMSVSSFGLLLRSNYQLGWKVFYGPTVNNLELVQVICVSVIIVLVYLCFKYIKNYLYLLLLILSFGLDRVLSIIRYTYLFGQHYLGITVGVSRFIAISLSEKRLGFKNILLEPTQFHSLTKFDFNSIWGDKLSYFVFYPLVHMGVALILYFIMKKSSKRVKIVTVVALALLLIWQLIYIFSTNPTSIIAL